ncbi:MAG: peptidoglycan DD-metalloendopeptidase family protein [Clostridia bacterium]|nr:peptidoglycan DD-metalloendopeptidase family protein [Clostridia bacterium]
MTRFRKTDFRSFVCILLIVSLVISASWSAFADFTYYADRTTTKAESTTAAESGDESTTASEELSQLQEKYDKLEEKIQQGEKSLSDVESGKKKQSKNIEIIQSNIENLDNQIDVLEKKVSVLNTDINKLNSSITVLNGEISQLNSSISETEDKIYEAQKKTDILYGKLKGRLVLNYMFGAVSNLEVLAGTKDLPSFFTKLEIIRNLSAYDKKLLTEFEANLTELQNLNAVLSADKTALDTKESTLSGEKNTLAGRQSDMESSQYVLDLKKQLSEHKYKEAVDYFKTLDSTSGEYSAALKLLSKEQDKVDAQINAYLLKYGSSADDDVRESVTNPSEESTTLPPSTTKKSTAVITAYTGTAARKTTSATQTTESETAEITFPTTKISVVTPETIELIWPLPYKNCYISAYYGQYPSGGEHHGLDICVRGGTEGKNVVAAADGVVISYGFNHWSMGNYIIIDHGHGLFTAYYHMQKLFAEQGDHVQQGQVIGLAGHTGNTTGPHLHFEVRVSRGGVITRMNPLKFVKMPG